MLAFVYKIKGNLKKIHRMAYQYRKDKPQNDEVGYLQGLREIGQKGYRKHWRISDHTFHIVLTVESMQIFFIFQN